MTVSKQTNGTPPNAASLFIAANVMSEWSSPQSTLSSLMLHPFSMKWSPNYCAMTAGHTCDGIAVTILFPNRFLVMCNSCFLSFLQLAIFVVSQFFFVFTSVLLNTTHWARYACRCTSRRVCSHLNSARRRRYFSSRSSSVYHGQSARNVTVIVRSRAVVDNDVTRRCMRPPCRQHMPHCLFCQCHFYPPEDTHDPNAEKLPLYTFVHALWHLHKKLWPCGHRIHSHACHISTHRKHSVVK